MTRASPGKSGADLATMPCDVMSLDFSFSGMVTEDSTRPEDMVGMNGEVGWTLAQDQFFKIIHVETKKNEAAPAAWLDEFSERHAPPGSTARCVFLDQGGELCGSHAVASCA